MQVHSTSNVNTIVSSGSDTTTCSAQSLSQVDFLKLLVAQMTSQNPLNPLNNQDLPTQTVQLSTLQSNTSLQSALTQIQGTQSLAQAGSLLGWQVTLQATSSTTAQGVVSRIDVSSATARIVVNGTPYDLSQVLSISPHHRTSNHQP